MQVEIREGYDVVLIAENERDAKRLKKINDKYASCGLTFDLIASSVALFQITLRPRDPEEQTLELGG